MAQAEYRVREDLQDAITEDGQDRISEQAPWIEAWLDGLYIRVTERSPSTPHPDPGQDYLTRATEQWWAPSVPDYRILQRQLIAGATVAVATATLRTHVGERHYLTASRARPRLIARSDFRKTRAA